MQPINFVNSIEWFDEQLSPQFKSVLLRHGPFQDNLADVMDDVITAAHELSAMRQGLIAHPFLPAILRQFGLGALLSEGTPAEVTRLVLNLVSKGETRDRPVHYQLFDLTRDLFQADPYISYTSMLEAKAGVRSLLIPEIVDNEKDFDEILTLEWKYPHGEYPRLESISKSISSVLNLYKSTPVQISVCLEAS